MSTKVLECKNLYKSFGKKKIIKNISLDMYEGDILGFIGPNGAGKTTTIKMILGLQSIDKGEVNINGFNIKTDFVTAITKVGAIVENPDMYMYLSGRKNLELVRNMYDNVSKERIEEVIKIVKLEARINDKVSKYSLGMRQRLGIAQALLHNPNILILDEPTNGLDPEGIKELRDLLKYLAIKENKAVLISSHNLSELESFCNKVCIIKNGEIIETTEVKSLKKEVTKTTYLIELNTIKNIKKVIKEEFDVNDKVIRIEIEKENIPNLIKKLVDANYLIYRVSEVEISLEDAFLKKVGGNKID